MNLRSYLCLFALFALAPPSHAEFDKRIYLGVSGGASFIEPEPNETGYRVAENSDGAAKFVLGWDFARRWSLEGYYTSLGEATLEQEAGQTLDPTGGDVAYQAGGVSALYYLFNTDGSYGYEDREGLSLYAKAGVGVLDTSSETLDVDQLNGAHLMLGVGLEWAFESGLGLRLEVDAYDKDAQYASIGFLWRFGRDASTGRVDSGDRLSTPAIQPVPSPSPPVVYDPPTNLDTDNDGVPDTQDDCLRSAPGEVVDAAGCAAFSGTLEGVNFVSGSAQLTGEAKTVLDRVAVQLQSNPSVRVAIMAHTDNAGPASTNIELSKRRAISVASYLVERGVEPGRLRPEAYGESRPRASNATADGRQQNRRVEIRRL